MVKVCLQCLHAYETNDRRQSFCSRNCWSDSRKKPLIIKKCKQCKKEFSPKQRDNVSRNAVFCSQKCYGLYRKENYSGVNHNSWRGGVTYSNGYRYIYLPNHPNANHIGYYMEHRKVMEEQIERLLDPINEVVHHRDGNRLNNKIENLELMNRANHLLLHHFPDKYGKTGH